MTDTPESTTEARAGAEHEIDLLGARQAVQQARRRVAAAGGRAVPEDERSVHVDALAPSRFRRRARSSGRSGTPDGGRSGGAELIELGYAYRELTDAEDKLARLVVAARSATPSPRPTGRSVEEATPVHVADDPRIDRLVRTATRLALDHTTMPAGNAALLMKLHQPTRIELVAALARVHWEQQSTHGHVSGRSAASLQILLDVLAGERPELEGGEPSRDLPEASPGV